MAACIVCPKRPLLALPFLLPSCEPVALELRRNQSTYRRTKQRLRVKPDASFGASNQSRDQIIYNPPPTAPSVYQTPTKFLPPDDARRALRTDASSGPENVDSFASIYKSSPEKTYHLSQSDIEEIRKLRLNDPMNWSRWKLAKRFGCSPMFIAMVCEAAPEKKEMQKQILEAIQSRWGAKRRMAREDRQLRRETWGRDE